MYVIEQSHRIVFFYGDVLDWCDWKWFKW